MTNSENLIEIPPPERKGRKPKQEHLPGQEPQEKIAAVHLAIESYVEVRDQRMKLAEEEVRRRTLLGHVMKKHGITHYAVDGHIAEIESEEKIKAKVKHEEDEPELEKVKELRAPRSRKARGKHAAAGE